MPGGLGCATTLSISFRWTGEKVDAGLSDGGRGGAFHCGIWWQMSQALQRNRSSDDRAAASQRFQDFHLDPSTHHERADHHVSGIEPAFHVRDPARHHYARLMTRGIHEPFRWVSSYDRQSGLGAAAQNQRKDVF